MVMEDNTLKFFAFSIYLPDQTSARKPASSDGG
jgi:hypothetical protein